MSNGNIPYGTYDVEIGSSFLPSSSRKHSKLSPLSPPDGNIHTLRYDFKPKSVASEQETYICLSENRDVQVIVPSEDMNNLTVYKGSKKPIRGDKECVLIFNHDLNKFTLEKFSSNIGVKKTRGNDEDVEDIRAKIQELRKTKVIGNQTEMDDQSMPMVFAQPIVESAKESATTPSAHSHTSHSSSSSSEDEQSDNDNADDVESNSDDDAKALESIVAKPSPPMKPIENVVMNDLYMSDDASENSGSDNE